MLTKTKKEKCMFQQNDVKPRNIKDPKNTIKALREEADQVQQKTSRLASDISTEPLLLCHPLCHLRSLNPAQLGSCTVTYSWVRTDFGDLQPVKHGRSDRVSLKAKCKEVLQLLFWACSRSSLSKPVLRREVWEFQVSPASQQSSQGTKLMSGEGIWDALVSDLLALNCPRHS